MTKSSNRSFYEAVSEAKIFGTKQKECWESIMALTANLSHFFWKNVSLDLIMEHQNSNSKPCENGVKFNIFLG